MSPFEWPPPPHSRPAPTHLTHLKPGHLLYIGPHFLHHLTGHEQLACPLILQPGHHLHDLFNTRAHFSPLPSPQQQDCQELHKADLFLWTPCLPWPHMVEPLALNPVANTSPWSRGATAWTRLWLSTHSTPTWCWLACWSPPACHCRCCPSYLPQSVSMKLLKQLYWASCM